MLAKVPDVFTLGWLLDHGVRIVAVLGLAIGVSWLARMAVRRMRQHIEGSESVTQEDGMARSFTLTQALSSAIRIVIWTFAVLLIIGELGLELGPLLAGAGVAGVALGFGAQTLVRDFLSGFFILLEQQYGVGQLVRLQTEGASVEGKVESVSLRVTVLRDSDGTLHVVPNGNILLVGNMYRRWARAIVDVPIASDEDVGSVREILDDLFDDLRRDEDLEPSMFSGPEVLGVEASGDQGVVLRVEAQTKPSRKLHVERELRRRIKECFDERGVRVLMPRRVVLVSSRASQTP